LEAGFVALGGGSGLDTGDHYAMLRLAFPFYNLSVAVSQLAGNSGRNDEGNTEGFQRSASR